MKFTLSIVSTVLAACQLVAAVPAESTSNDGDVSAVSNDEPPPGTVTYCINTQYRSPCNTVPVDDDSCIAVTPPFVNQISSIQPAQNLNCTFYTVDNCDSYEDINVQYPGIPDLTQTDYNDALNSFRCFKTN